MQPELKPSFKSSYNVSYYSRYNIKETESDINVFVSEYKDRILQQLELEEEGGRTPFASFARQSFSDQNLNWLEDNTSRFFKNTENDSLVKKFYLAEYGHIYCMIFTPDGVNIIVGHSTGLVQERASNEVQDNRDGHEITIMSEEKDLLAEYAVNNAAYYNNEVHPKIWYPMFYLGKLKERNRFAWVTENHEKFLKGSPNQVVYNRWFFSESGAVTAMEYSPNGYHIIVGHSSGLIQMRHGSTGTVLCTLRNIQFPPKPVFALAYSLTEDRVCYAACMDGAIYRIEIPNIDSSVLDPPVYCIQADPLLDSLNMQFYGTPGISLYATPFITQRFAALSLGLLAEQTKMAVGYADTSLKIYDMETQQAELTYKVHKLRLQFIPKKLRRMHFGQVCALRCHPQKPYIFASGGWDNTLRIWDVRCKVGCVMTFEGVNICGDSIDLNREHCLAGSWQPTEAVTVWDLVARKKLNVVRVQNRRPDVDGEYIYACRYWHSTDYNRKGKYAVIGGSGTNCVEVINLHNRYITCSYPTAGTILATCSYEERIAFGGSSSAFSIVTFFDPKHEKDKYQSEFNQNYDYTKAAIALYEDEDDTSVSSDNLPPEEGNYHPHSHSITAAATIGKFNRVSKLM